MFEHFLKAQHLVEFQRLRFGELPMIPHIFSFVLGRDKLLLNSHDDLVPRFIVSITLLMTRVEFLKEFVWFHITWMVMVWFVGFYSISTFVGYLTPNLFLCK